MEQGTQWIKDFELGEPALVCRWRIAGGRLPLENRHLRALGARTVVGRPVSTQLLSWAKQHIEWTLTDGSAANPDGVLMLLMDAEGRAAMSVGPYEPLADTSVAALAGRASSSALERAETGVAPETLWAVHDGALVWGAADDDCAHGAASLVLDLASTLGIEVARDAALLDAAVSGDLPGQVFLCSDEHGVVPAAGASDATVQRLVAGYQKLLEHERAQR